MVEAIRDALIELRPEQRDDFHANAEAFSSQLTVLDEYAHAVLASVPEASRVLVTAHDAFGYFGDAYAFEVLGIQGFSTESEAGLARIEELVNLLVNRQIGMIDHNVTLIARALGGEAPLKGMQGRLGADRERVCAKRPGDPCKPSGHSRAHGELWQLAGGLLTGFRHPAGQPDRDCRP